MVSGEIQRHQEISSATSEITNNEVDRRQAGAIPDGLRNRCLRLDEVVDLHSVQYTDHVLYTLHHFTVSRQRVGCTQSGDASVGERSMNKSIEWIDSIHNSVKSLVPHFGL